MYGIVKRGNEKDVYKNGLKGFLKLKERKPQTREKIPGGVKTRKIRAK
jgi:hypothetical protein